MTSQLPGDASRDLFMPDRSLEVRRDSSLKNVTDGSLSHSQKRSQRIRWYRNYFISGDSGWWQLKYLLEKITPYGSLGKMIQFDEHNIFSDGLVQLPTIDNWSKTTE